MIGIDFTLVDFDTTAICNSVKDYLDNPHVSDGSLIIAVAVHRKTFIHSVILASAHLPRYAGIKNRERRNAIDRFLLELRQSLSKRQSFPDSLVRQSRIDEFFNFATTIFENSHIVKKDRKMLLISDMLQVDAHCNWETGKIDASHLQLPKVGGSISILGVRSPRYRDSAMWNTVKEAWLRLFGSAEIKMLQYSLTLQLPQG